MCREMDQIYNEGVEQGIERGIEQGIERGIEQGIEQGKINTLLSLVKDGLLSIVDAAKRADMDLTTFKQKYDAYLK